VVAELAAIGVLLMASIAEFLHGRRIRRVRELAFGPTGRPTMWVALTPGLRAGTLAALTWGLITLLYVSPKVHQAEAVTEGDFRHVILVLDVSPSMRLEDAGPDGQLSRLKRTSEIMESFFKRVTMQQYRMSVVAVYTSALPVVIDTYDIDVVRNIISDLPMHHAFTAGKTDLFSGLEKAAEIARPWAPKSTTVILLSDGDTVPATGMPRMPPAVASLVVVGVGDPTTGKFIDGRQSRQDVSTLRQIAARLSGVYHNGNDKHLSSELLKQLTAREAESVWAKLTKREYAMIVAGISALIYAFLPIALHFLGTRWRPGVRTKVA
jgi:Ca-activated chloride channel family protein